MAEADAYPDRVEVFSENGKWHYRYISENKTVTPGKTAFDEFHGAADEAFTKFEHSVKYFKKNESGELEEIPRLTLIQNHDELVRMKWNREHTEGM